jgi:hypothetical protein
MNRRNPRSRRYAAVATTLAAAIVGVIAMSVPVTAAPSGAVAGNVRHPNLVTSTGGPYDCAANGNPDPQYSSSNRTLHWGIRVDYCSATTTVQIKGALQELDGGSWYTQDKYPSSGWKTTIGAGWGTTRSINCVSNVPHQWRIQVYMLIDGVPGDPNPGYSDIYTLPCE